MRSAVQRLFWGGLAGKLLGLVREVLLAAAYGTGAPAAAARVAQTATLVPVDLFTADALSAGFLPVHAELRRRDPARAAALFHGLRALLLAVALVVTVALLLLAGTVVDLLAPGLDGATAGTAATFLRVMALGVPSYLQFALLSCLEASHGSFRLSSARATVQNAGMVAGLAVAWWLSAPVALAWGFPAAYVALHVWAHRSLRRLGLLPPARRDRRDARAALAQLWRRVRPLLLLPVVLQASVVAERVVASLLGDGVVAAVDYARFIATTGVSLLAVPLGLAGLAVLPGLSATATRERLERLVPAVLVVVVPLSAVLAVDAGGVVHVLYGRGAFDASAVATSAQVLTGFAVGFWAQAVSYVLVKALNARDRNRAAVTALVAGLAVTLAVDLTLPAVLGPVALGLAVSAGAVVTTLLAARALGVGAVLVRCAALCAPGALLAGLAAALVGAAVPGTWAGLVLGSAAALVVWGLHVVCVPALRRALAQVLRRPRP
ncbi:lipid II flippase MurJ [Kineococcus esterisolvens]|uniref:lipid II flippase MurJ n=1 Tax=unclassified Kineococcus TaxID=2621656 RepID=UPI003D7CCC8D